MSALTYGSVCSGIEAATVAWHPLGWRAAWFSEIEPFPSAVLAHHYPDVPNLGDMTTIAARVLRGSVPAPDVLVGGTPCQAFSVAGQRESLADERGNLTLRYVELANAIDDVRRRAGQPDAVIVWENVPGVLSTKDNAFGCFLAGLAGEDDPLEPPGKRWANTGAVYGPRRAVAWRTLDAQYFGLAQRRRRVFVVASARDGFDPAQVLFEWDGVRRDSAPSRSQGQGATVGTLGGTSPGGGWRVGADEAAEGQLIPDTVPTLDASYGRLQGCSGQDANHGHGHLIATKSAAAAVAFTQNSRSEVRLISGDGSVTGALAAEPGAQQQTYVAFDCRQDPVSSAEVFGALGSSSPQAQAIAFKAGAGAKAGGVAASSILSPTLGASGSGNQAAPALARREGVRRLTPRECERLQGYADDYTLILYRGKPAADGPRYKALGNSMATPVMRWIGERIRQHLEVA